MNREGAETFLRLLAEAEMRDQLAPDPPPWAGAPGTGRVKVNVVGQALIAVRALDQHTVRDVLADFDLAVSLRRLHATRPGPGTSPNQAARGPWGIWGIWGTWGFWGFWDHTDQDHARRVGGPPGRTAPVRPARPAGYAPGPPAARQYRATGPAAPGAARTRHGSGHGRQVRADRPDHPVS